MKIMMDAMKLYSDAQSSQKDCLGKSQLQVEDLTSCMKDVTDVYSHIQDIL